MRDGSLGVGTNGRMGWDGGPEANSFIYLFIYFDIQRHPHRYNSGYYVQVKDDSDKNSDS